MNLDSVDRENPMPIAHQLAEILKKKILDDEYPAHSLFPTEEQLTNRYSVSRTTVRMALSTLVNEKLIIREQGRGTFVCSRKAKENTKSNSNANKRLSRDVVEIKSTTNIIRAAGMTPSSKVLCFTAEKPDEQVAKSLKIRMEHAVWYFERIRYADETPILLEKLWIPQFLCPDLTEEVLEHSLYKFIVEKCEYKLGEAHQILRAVSLSEEDANLLEEEKGSPAMYIRGITYMDDGRPIELENSLFNSEVMEFIMDLGKASEFARIRNLEEIK